ncbi:MAG: hypothetical protein M5R37_14190 [Melioribacteraceae bacterium]|nr:hypothetical protein [Melioribacteraceae bacterium]
MARVDQQLLGVVNGKIGNLVFRRVNGKTFVSNRPQKYNITGTEESTLVKNGFKNLIMFSAYLNSIPLIKTVWGSKTIRGNRAYNKIFSHNKSHIKSVEISELFRIIPDPPDKQILIFKTEVEQNYAYIDFLTDYKAENCIYNYVLVFYSKHHNQFMHQLGEIEKPEIHQRTLLNIELNNDAINFINLSGKVIIYFGLIVQDQSGAILTWSTSNGQVYK